MHVHSEVKYTVKIIISWYNIPYTSKISSILIPVYRYTISTILNSAHNSDIIKVIINLFEIH